MDDPIEELVDEVRLLWNSLVQRGERLHAADDITMGQRAVLEFLARNGPTPVPEIARRRRVSRQHIQSLVNPLLERRLVVTAPNPAHKRSLRMQLSPAGERRIAGMKRREARLFRRVVEELGETRLRRASGTLRGLRAVIEE